MPGGDGTGPVGMGPMSGRAAGFCAGYAVPGYMNPVGGRGMGGFGRGRGGRGGGRGWRNRFYATGLFGWQRAAMGYPPVAAAPVAPGVAPFAATATGDQQLGALKTQADYLANALEDVRKRIEELEGQAKEE